MGLKWKPTFQHFITFPFATITITYAIYNRTSWWSTYHDASFLKPVCLPNWKFMDTVTGTDPALQQKHVFWLICQGSQAILKKGYIHRSARWNTLEITKDIVARVALEYICAHYNIIISDHDYHAFEVAKRNMFSMHDKVCITLEIHHDTSADNRSTKWIHKTGQAPSNDMQTNTYPSSTNLRSIISCNLDRMQQYAKAIYHFITGTNPVGGCTNDRSYK